MLQHLKKMYEPRASLLLLLLLSADSTLMIFFAILEISASELCHPLGMCGSMHIYNLIKLFWVIFLFAYLLRSTRCSSYISWMLVFTYFLFDDALLLHQNIGDRILNSFSTYGLGLPSRFYELAVLAIAGFVLLTIVAWAYFHGSQTFRKISIDILLLIAALVVFGLIVDMAKVITLGPAVIFGLGFVEDGGELVVNSLIVWYVFLLAMRKGKSDVFLLELVWKP